MAKDRRERRDTFICYARSDARFVSRLVEDLSDHHITSWIDTLDIKVGDTSRQRIEAGIESARHFCFVISPASMKSFYVQQVELEAAFAHMVASKRPDFILPLMLQRPRRRLPAMLASKQYLDFTRSRLYLPNMLHLVKKLNLEDEHFTGARWYKNIDTSLTGQMIGVGEPLKQLPDHGAAVRVFFEDGVIRWLETYTDGATDGAKSVAYDHKRRVIAITLFRNNTVVDTWNYVYDPQSGRRTAKLIARPGEQPHTRLDFNSKGYTTKETHLHQDGSLDDAAGYAVEEFSYNSAGALTSRALYDAHGKPLKTSLRSRRIRH